MGISLSLAQLKEYFQVWHQNNFDALHNTKLETYITDYLSRHQISDKINSIDNIKTSIVNIAKFLSKSIDGDSDLTNSSTLTNAITELSNKNINFSDINLKQLSDIINQHDGRLDSLLENKADKDYVLGLIATVESRLGITPEQIATQDIPAKDYGYDLNNYTTPGLYRSKDSSVTQNVQSLPNGASNQGFSLVVLQHMENSVRQILLTPENSANGNAIYTRNYVHSQSSGGQWSEWYELYGTHNTTPLQMKVEWSEGGSTTYTLLQK